jgi:hypothetical protein
MSLTSYRAAPPRDKLELTGHPLSVLQRKYNVPENLPDARSIFRSQWPDAIPHPIAGEFYVFQVNAL